MKSAAKSFAASKITGVFMEQNHRWPKRHNEVNPENRNKQKEREMDASHLKGTMPWMDAHPVISSILFWFIFMEEIRLSKINTTMFDYIIITTNKILLICTEIYLVVNGSAKI